MHTNMWVVDNSVEIKKDYPQLQEARNYYEKMRQLRFRQKQYTDLEQTQ